MRSIPSWILDILIAATLAAIGLVIERQTDGRLFTSTIVLWVGGGSFLLLRLGAILARAGRTLGCLFTFAITWLLPCIVVLTFAISPDMQATIRDSSPFFLSLGLFLIAIMIITFERIRIADQARFAASQPQDT